MKTITIPAPVDMHVHFRQDDMLKNVVHHHDRVFEFALAMPNTTPPIATAEDVVKYRSAIMAHCTRMRPLIAVKLLPTTTPDMLNGAHGAGAVAAKLYPAGATHNSDDGIDYRTISILAKPFYDMLGTMQELGMMLCVHGEVPEEFSLDAEKQFLYPLRNIIKTFPRLKVVLEHITTKDAIFFVKDFDNCAATVTLQHLLITHDDVAGRKLRPHNFCLPIAKRPSDLQSLREIVFARHPRIFFGSDSAPHTKETKECAEGCAGCFTAPLLLEGLCYALATSCGEGIKKVLKGFVSDHAREWYGLTAPSYEVILKEEKWVVPTEIGGVVPFMAGQALPWKVVD